MERNRKKYREDDDLCLGEGLADERDEDERDEQCLEECRRTCKRHFWTEMLRAIVKVSTIVLAAFGLSSFDSSD